ncbi:hypothetical protein VTK73DRAFT_1966 [Phialemonium thermophilum]|uniref:Bromo domain-containing protein n=1 Tax=Phialemonium thermophilum TaxID=223376 RepID=A0ABR3VSR6_9PEZI
MNDILKKIKKEEYKSLGDLRRDIELLCNNCRTFNEDGSILYSDANVIESFFREKLQQELNEHPELAEWEEGSRKENSAGPSTTGTGTPQPTSNGPTRIKLVSTSSNGPSQTNGENSAAQSDDE